MIRQGPYPGFHWDLVAGCWTEGPLWSGIDIESGSALFPSSASTGLGDESCQAGLRRLRSWTLQESQVERQEHQNDSDVHHQPLPQTVPEEQDIYAEHNRCYREDVKPDGRLPSHASFLPHAAARVVGPCPSGGSDGQGSS